MNSFCASADLGPVSRSHGPAPPRTAAGPCTSKSQTVGVPVATLASAQARAMDELLSGSPLPQVLEVVAEALESVAGPGVHAVVMMGEDRSRLACAASPSLEPGRCLDWLELKPPAQVTSTEARILDIEALPTGLPWREATLRHQLRAFWSVPIQGAGGRLLGTLDTYWPAPLPESLPASPADALPPHAEAARLLARTAALAIEHDRVCRRLERLESGRQQPTAMQFPQQTDELTELTRHLQAMQEEERSLLARELHDRLGAFFTATKFDMARLKSALGPLSPEVAMRLAHFTDMLDKGIALKRRMIEDLRPSALNSLGLVQALEILINEFKRTHGVSVITSLEPLQMPPNVQLTMYRLVQEALVNVAAYAQAKEVQIWLKNMPEAGVEIGVRDDGVGFDVQTGRISMLGLMGMHYRVEAQGGRFTVESCPDCGTTVSAVFPAQT